MLAEKTANANLAHMSRTRKPSLWNLGHTQAGLLADLVSEHISASLELVASDPSHTLHLSWPLSSATVSW